MDTVDRQDYAEMGDQAEIRESRPWQRRHALLLSGGLLCLMGAVVVLSATTKGSSDVESLFGTMQRGISKSMPMPLSRPGFLPGSQRGIQSLPQSVTWGKNFHLGHQVVMRAEAEADEVPFTGGEAWSKKFAEPETVFDILKIKEVLPHRYPFLLVDKIIEFVPGKKAVGIKKVTTNEEFFNGHFPKQPIMPGVLQIEAMAQVGGLIALQEPLTDGKGDFFFAGLDAVKWRKPVVPGDTLVMEMELTKFSPKFGVAKMKGASYVDGVKVVEAEFQFALVK